MGSLQDHRAQGGAIGAECSVRMLDDAVPGERDGGDQRVGAVRRRLRGKTRAVQAATGSGYREQHGDVHPGGGALRPDGIKSEMNTIKCTSLGHAALGAAAVAAVDSCEPLAAGRPPSQTRPEGGA